MIIKFILSYLILSYLILSNVYLNNMEKNVKERVLFKNYKERFERSLHL